MSIKDNQTSQVSEFREAFKKKFENEFAAIRDNINQKARMQIALNIDKSFITVNRYINGDIRSLELAESILSACKDFLKQQPATAAQ